MNSVNITGYYGDPQYNRSNKVSDTLSVYEFSIGVYKKKKSGEAVYDYYKCAAWGSIGETIESSFKKGDKIFVSGSLGTNKWQDKNGQNRKDVYINIQNVGPILEKPREQKSDQTTPEGDSW